MADKEFDDIAASLTTARSFLKKVYQDKKDAAEEVARITLELEEEKKAAKKLKKKLDALTVLQPSAFSSCRLDDDGTLSFGVGCRVFVNYKHGSLDYAYAGVVYGYTPGDEYEIKCPGWDNLIFPIGKSSVWPFDAIFMKKFELNKKNIQIHSNVKVDASKKNITIVDSDMVNATATFLPVIEKPEDLHFYETVTCTFKVEGKEHFTLDAPWYNIVLYRDEATEKTAIDLDICAPDSRENLSRMTVIEILNRIFQKISACCFYKRANFLPSSSPIIPTAFDISDRSLPLEYDVPVIVLSPSLFMNQSDQRHNLCLSAAQRGEALCRNGQTELGIEQLEKALEHGTADVYLLSAIYAQLGNAFYALKNMQKSVDYHSQDLVLCRAMGDKLGETNCFSNLAIVRTTMSDYEKALPCVDSNTSLSLELGEPLLVCRAHYTKGYVYLKKSRDSAPSLKDDFLLFAYPVRNSSIPDDAREDLYTAVESFQKCAKFAEDLNDQSYCALAYGNLGHAHFLLEEYEASIKYHKKRLEIARSVDDKNATRRAFTNLGNANFFASEFPQAIECYQNAVQVAEELGDIYLQSNAWFSVGIVATVNGDIELATTAHLRHLQLSRELEDRQAQIRSLTSLASLYSACKDLPKALYFLILKYKLTLDMRDQDSEMKTRQKIRIAVQSDPESVIRDNKVVLDASRDPDLESLLSGSESPPLDTSSIAFALREDCRAVSAPNLAEPLSKFIIDCAKGLKPIGLVIPTTTMDNMYVARSMPNVQPDDDDYLCDMYERMSKQRLDDQRCDPSVLRHLTNHVGNARQADTLKHGSASKIYGSKSSLKKSFIGSLKKPFSSSKKAKKGLISSTPAPNVGKRAISMDCSHISGIPHLTGSIKSFPSVTSVVSTPDPSHVFRVPPLPQRARTRMSDFGYNKENINGDRRPASVLSFGMQRYASSDTFYSVSRSVDMEYIDEADVEPEEMVTVSKEQRLRKTAGDGIYNPEAILDLIASIQSRRMNEQRADFLPGLRNRQTILNRFREELEQRKKMLSSEEREVDEKLYNLIVKFQGDRIEEQRSALGGPSPVEKDVSEIVLKMASGRMDEQRADLKSPTSKSANTPDN